MGDQTEPHEAQSVKTALIETTRALEEEAVAHRKQAMMHRRAAAEIRRKLEALRPVCEAWGIELIIEDAGTDQRSQSRNEREGTAA